MHNKVHVAGEKNNFVCVFVTTGASTYEYWSLQDLRQQALEDPLICAPWICSPDRLLIFRSSVRFSSVWGGTT